MEIFRGADDRAWIQVADFAFDRYGRRRCGVALSDDERAEAEGLVDLAEALSLLKLRAERARRERK